MDIVESLFIALEILQEVDRIIVLLKIYVVIDERGLDIEHILYRQEAEMMVQYIVHRLYESIRVSSLLSDDHLIPFVFQVMVSFADGPFGKRDEVSLYCFAHLGSRLLLVFDGSEDEIAEDILP